MWHYNLKTETLAINNKMKEYNRFSELWAGNLRKSLFTASPLPVFHEQVFFFLLFHKANSWEIFLTVKSWIKLGHTNRNNRFKKVSHFAFPG